MSAVRRLVLASGSMVRARLLRDAGLDFDVVPSSVDEDDIKRTQQGLDTESLALVLARAKAREISQIRPKDLVIGADQILDCEGARFDKPKDKTEAASHLRRLNGRPHRLVTACTIYCGCSEVWKHESAPRLTMRSYDESFIETYLTRAGDGVLTSVGAYQLEGLGAHLFDTIEGDYFTILGLPLLSLLAFLRTRGLLVL